MNFRARPLITLQHWKTPNEFLSGQWHSLKKQNIWTGRSSNTWLKIFHAYDGRARKNRSHMQKLVETIYKKSFMQAHRIYHDDIVLFNTGFSLRICKDSHIFLWGWLLVFWRIKTDRGVSLCENWLSGWTLIKWSPKGLSEVLFFFALRTCSLKRSLIGLFVSPTYETSSPLPSQSTQETR